MGSYSCCGISGVLVEVAHYSERYVTMVLLPCPWSVFTRSGHGQQGK